MVKTHPWFSDVSWWFCLLVWLYEGDLLCEIAALYLAAVRLNIIYLPDIYVVVVTSVNMLNRFNN